MTSRGLGIGLGGIADLKGGRLGEAGVVGALAGEVDARRRQINARQARRAHLEERHPQRRRPAAELEHARPAQGRVAEQVEIAPDTSTSSGKPSSCVQPS